MCVGDSVSHSLRLCVLLGFVANLEDLILEL